MFTTDVAVLGNLAAVLKQYDATPSPPVVAPTGAFWTQIVLGQHVRAYNEIVARLVARGYDAATQIPDWDRGAEWELQLATLYALEAGGAAEAVDDRLLAKLRSDYADLGSPQNPKGLNAVLLTIGAVAKYPADAPGTVGSGATGLPDETALGPDPDAPRMDVDSFGWRF